jgi:hypothetical protein
MGAVRHCDLPFLAKISRLVVAGGGGPIDHAEHGRQLSGPDDPGMVTVQYETKRNGEHSCWVGRRGPHSIPRASVK